VHGAARCRLPCARGRVSSPPLREPGESGGVEHGALLKLRAIVAAAQDPHAAGALDALERLGLGGRSALERPIQQPFQTRLLEAIANGVITITPHGTISTFNRAAVATFGTKSGDMLGRPAATLGAVIRKFPELLDTFYKSGAVQLRAEVVARAAGGPTLLLEMRMSSLESTDGIGVAVVVIDITRQRHLEERNAEQLVRAAHVRESFTRYLAPHVVQSLMDDPSSLKLGGERSRATTFFADVRGFTRITRALPPERVVEILNAYFDEAVRVVFEHDGLLDKFYGDGLMAVFGPPRVRVDDAARAVAAAIALHDAMQSLRERLRYPLEISVGLATGDVVAGHFGSAKRMDYTVIGDAVNLANALQSAAPPGAIYCDAETIASAGDVARPVRRVDVALKGRTGYVTAYVVLPASEPARIY